MYIFIVAASSCHCDWHRRNNFYELQQILFTSYLVDGDSFVLFKRRFATEECPYSLRLQTLEAARVSNPQDSGTGVALSPVEMQGTRNGGRIINGIEIDRNGRLLAIWVSNKIWNEPYSLDAELKWKRVKVFGETTGCRNVLHICKDTRIEQYRGVPYLAPVIETLKQVARYADSELTASIVKTFFSIFFTQPLGTNMDFNDILPNGEISTEPVVDVTEYKLGSGTISALPRGVDVKAIDRANAQNSFDAFMSSFMKMVGAALGLPYEVLLKNFQASYSASKAALQMAEEEFRQRRNAFIVDFCQPVFEMWLTEAVALGRVEAPGFEDPLKRFCWTRCDFRTETSHLLDPVKEMNAAKLRIEMGLSTREKEAAQLCGTDFFDNVDALTIENQLLENVTPKEETVDDESDSESISRRIIFQ